MSCKIWTKICGIRDLKTALYVEKLGYDALGLNFYQNSKRYIFIDEAEIIVKKLTRIKKIGIFVNPSLEEIELMDKILKLDYIQLHGTESPEFIKQLPNNKVIKAIPADQNLKNNIKLYEIPELFALLIDSPTKQFGGSGKKFNWENFTFIKDITKRIIIAGGLNQDNFIYPLNSLSPFGLDFNSGVEDNNGKKNMKLLFQLKNKLEECNE